MKKLRFLLVPAVFAAGMVQAADVNAGAAVPVKPTLQSLKCATGMKAVSDGESLFCLAGAEKMAERRTGPFISLHKDGTKAGEGNYLNGNREGLWVFFDQQGNKTMEIEFKADNYNGKYVEFVAGRKIREETYVAGQRQGPQFAYDNSGVVTVTEYRNDRPVVK